MEQWITASNQVDMVQELRQILRDFSKRAKRFESDNIYHLMQFGTIRLAKDDFEGATNFYEQVIRMDPVWSAFAHYNRAYCTLHMKGDGYIGHAIDDLKDTHRKLETYKKRCVFSEILLNIYQLKTQFSEKSGTNCRSTQYYTMLECQLLHHIDTQIIETIRNLERIDTMGGEVTIVRRDILDLISDSDSRTEKMLQEYQQMGLIFTYNIDEKPKFCFRNSIVPSFVILESVADTMLSIFLRGKLVIGDSKDLEYMVDGACNVGTICHEALKWMSRCVSRAILTAIHSIHYIRDVSSLVPIKQTELESSSKMTAGTSQFNQFAISQARPILKLLESAKQEMSDVVRTQLDELILCMTDIAMIVVQEKIQQTIQENIVPQGKLHRELCCLYDNVTSKYQSNFRHYVDSIRDLAQLSANTSQLSDIHTTELQNIAVELMSNIRNGSDTATDLVQSHMSKIKSTAAKIEIGIVTAKFSDILCDKIHVFIQKTKADGSFRDDDHMIETASIVLISVWSGIIQEMLKNRITQSLFLDLQVRTVELFKSISGTLSADGEMVIEKDLITKLNTTTIYHSSACIKLSSRLKEYDKCLKETRCLRMGRISVARMLTKYIKRGIVILDDDQDEILHITCPENRSSIVIELKYNPPCRAYPAGYFEAFLPWVDVNVSSCKRSDDDDGIVDYDYNMLYSAVGGAWTERPDNLSSVIHELIEYINQTDPLGTIRFLAGDEYAYQLKLCRALLKLDESIVKINRFENAGDEPSHLLSCIEQALTSEHTSQLAMVLAEYESESRLFESNSPEHDTKLKTTSVSRDARKVFLSFGSSVEAHAFRKLVVERINDDDITTALKLCCIGHQLPFWRDKMDSNLPISDAQALRDTFKQMLNTESYERERSKFMSICDEWYIVLEPLGLMNIEQRELLREWITGRQYANKEDSVVSDVIKKALEYRKLRKRWIMLENRK